MAWTDYSTYRKRGKALFLCTRSSVRRVLSRMIIYLGHRLPECLNQPSSRVCGTTLGITRRSSEGDGTIAWFPLPKSSLHHHEFAVPANAGSSVPEAFHPHQWFRARRSIMGGVRLCGTGPTASLPNIWRCDGCYPHGVPVMPGRSSHLRSPLTAFTSSYGGQAR